MGPLPGFVLYLIVTLTSDALGLAGLPKLQDSATRSRHGVGCWPAKGSPFARLSARSPRTSKKRESLTAPLAYYRTCRAKQAFSFPLVPLTAAATCFFLFL